MHFFNQAYYIKAKLAQLSATGKLDGNDQPYTEATLLSAIKNAGLTPEEHYTRYGRNENINPNPYFNEAEYLHTKLAALQGDPKTADSWAGRGVDALVDVIQGQGMSPAEHYEKYGRTETTVTGHLLNPSNAFDANAYVAAKLAQLQLPSNPEAALWANKTVADLVQALQDANLSPLTHYQAYGAAEATASKVAMVQTVPSEQRMPNDPARVTITGEIVPSNYNPATPAPAASDAKPGAVTKPADVGGLVDAAVSPPVHVPAKPVPVPSDANYLAPPKDLVDTNEKPVLPPTSTDPTKPSGNWVVVNPDGSADLVKPDGTPGGSLPPGTLDPDNPVVPEAPVVPDTPGGGTGGGSGGGGTPSQDAPITKDLTSVLGKQNLNLGTGDDTVTGVKAEHLPRESAGGALDFGHMDGKAGNDSITLTAGAYNLHVGQLRSFENVTVQNTAQDFTWSIGGTDFPTGTYQPKAETAITATDLTTGKIRVDKPVNKELDLSVTTGSSGDDILVRIGQSGETNITSAAGDDRVVLVGGFERDGDTVTDTGVFGDISAACTTANGSAVTGTLDLGAGTNSLKVYGDVDLTQSVLSASSGSVSMELMGYRGIASITAAQYELLTANSQKIEATSGVSWLDVQGTSANTLDLSKVSIADNAHVNFILDNGVVLSRPLRIIFRHQPVWSQFCRALPHRAK